MVMDMCFCLYSVIWAQMEIWKDAWIHVQAVKGYLGDGVYVGEGEERGTWVPRKNKMKHVCDHSFECL